MMDDQTRDAARFIADAYAHERKRLRRYPTPDECCVAAFAMAISILDSHVGDRFSYYGLRRGPRSNNGNVFVTLASGRAPPSARLADQAEAALQFMTEAGDRVGAKPDSVAIDRKVMEALGKNFKDTCENFKRSGQINDCAAARQIDLSHTQVRDRRLARSLRILNRLHSDCPDLWSPKLRPIAEKSIASDNDERLAA
jgi:hypothetical protein